MHLPLNPPILPMLAKRVGEIPEGDTWLFEPKVVPPQELMEIFATGR